MIRDILSCFLCYIGWIIIAISFTYILFVHNLKASMQYIAIANYFALPFFLASILCKYPVKSYPYIFVLLWGLYVIAPLSGHIIMCSLPLLKTNRKKNLLK